MAWIYCLTCGKIIGEYYSIIDVDPYLEKAKTNHEPFCEGRPSELKYDEPTPLVDEFAPELIKKEKPIDPREIPEGWNWLYNTPKWHYFVNGASLCKRWLLFSIPEKMEQGNNNSPDNCKICKKMLLKRLERKV